jgi:aerobic-type carbon monoxide dehydrogenase small subunit (CoxS/CutS family)
MHDGLGVLVSFVDRLRSAFEEEPMAITIRVNNKEWPVEADPDTPLLYVLMNDLELKGPRFGCGLAQCGSCSVLADGVEIRSCQTPLSAVGLRSITTLEGLPELYATQRKLAKAPELHPLSQSFIDQQAMHCGYCYNGQTIKGAELLSRISNPTEAQIREHMDGHICRCGTYPRILKSIQEAAIKMAKEG